MCSRGCRYRDHVRGNLLRRDGSTSKQVDELEATLRDEALLSRMPAPFNGLSHAIRSNMLQVLHPFTLAPKGRIGRRNIQDELGQARDPLRSEHRYSIDAWRRVARYAGAIDTLPEMLAATSGKSSRSVAKALNAQRDALAIRPDVLAAISATISPGRQLPAWLESKGHVKPLDDDEKRSAKEFFRSHVEHISVANGGPLDTYAERLEVVGLMVDTVLEAVEQARAMSRLSQALEARAHDLARSGAPHAREFNAAERVIDKMLTDYTRQDIATSRVDLIGSLTMPQIVDRREELETTLREIIEISRDADFGQINVWLNQQPLEDHGVGSVSSRALWKKAWSSVPEVGELEQRSPAWLTDRQEEQLLRFLIDAPCDIAVAEMLREEVNACPPLTGKMAQEASRYADQLIESIAADVARPDLDRTPWLRKSAMQDPEVAPSIEDRSPSAASSQRQSSSVRPSGDVADRTPDPDVQPLIVDSSNEATVLRAYADHLLTVAKLRSTDAHDPYLEMVEIEGIYYRARDVRRALIERFKPLVVSGEFDHEIGLAADLRAAMGDQTVAAVRMITGSDVAITSKMFDVVASDASLQMLAVPEKLLELDDVSLGELPACVKNVHMQARRQANQQRTAIVRGLQASGDLPVIDFEHRQPSAADVSLPASSQANEDVTTPEGSTPAMVVPSKEAEEVPDVATRSARVVRTSVPPIVPPTSGADSRSIVSDPTHASGTRGAGAMGEQREDRAGEVGSVDGSTAVSGPDNDTLGF